MLFTTIVLCTNLASCSKDDGGGDDGNSAGAVGREDTTESAAEGCEYRILEKETDGQDALITSNGFYCIVMDTVDRRGNSIAVVGNINSTKCSYVITDSAGLVQNIAEEDSLYTLFYSKDSVIVYVNNQWERNVSYDDFYFGEGTGVETRASIITRNPIFRLLEIYDNVKGLGSTVALAKMLRRGKFNGALKNFLLDLVSIDVSTALRWIDGLLDYYFFGNASIETLPDIKEEACSYRLPCFVSLPISQTPYARVFERIGVSYSFRVGMQLTNTSIGGGKTQKTQSADESRQYDFVFSNLEPGTNYDYEPCLNICYQLPGEAFRASIDPDRDKPITFYKSIYGNKREFMTAYIGCSAGKNDNVTDSSAEITCSFSNIPSGAECGIKLFRESETNGVKHPGATADGEQTITVSGLKPSTSYSYIAYVSYKGKEYTSLNGGAFVTAYPSIVGTWSCTEGMAADSYTITLNADGTATINDGMDYLSAGWSRSGKMVYINGILIATQTQTTGKQWEGEILSLESPTYIKGTCNTWNYNTIGSYRSEPASMTMTR